MYKGIDKKIVLFIISVLCCFMMYRISRVSEGFSGHDGPASEPYAMSSGGPQNTCPDGYTPIIRSNNCDIVRQKVKNAGLMFGKEGGKREPNSRCYGMVLIGATVNNEIEEDPLLPEFAQFNCPANRNAGDCEKFWIIEDTGSKWAPPLRVMAERPQNWVGKWNKLGGPPQTERGWLKRGFFKANRKACGGVRGPVDCAPWWLFRNELNKTGEKKLDVDKFESMDINKNRPFICRENMNFKQKGDPDRDIPTAQPFTHPPELNLDP